MAGVPARSVPEHRPPGRAVVGEAAWECQLVVPRALPPEVPTGTPRPRSGALRIPALEADPLVPLPEGGRPGPALTVPLGPGGDEGSVLTVDLLRSGGLLVAGPPASGRSAALSAITTHVGAAGAPVLRLRAPGSGPPDDGGVADRQVAGRVVTWLDPDDLDGWVAWTLRVAGSPAVVAVDDHAAVAETPVLAAIGSALPAGVVAVLTGTAAELSSAYRGPVAALRRRRSGLLLCPGPGDADLLGVRLPRAPVPVRPGSGWLVQAGVPHRIQVALRRGPAVAA
jgi:S-DNA-T family DNA segregation ATPase FtsK/SpoIIIE